jgi:methylated-DNA-[protein]-cysteine S-methyltransferase
MLGQQTAPLFFDQFDSPVGVIGILAGPAGVRSVGWRLSPGGAAIEPDETVQQVLRQLREYFAGQRREFDLVLDLPPLEPRTRAVLQTLAETVRYAETITYGELARRSNTGLPARAIGSVMGANPVPIIIGCHRVVASDGLGGYSGGEPGHGLEAKRWMLELERALPPTLL